VAWGDEDRGGVWWPLIPGRRLDLKRPMSDQERSLVRTRATTTLLVMVLAAVQCVLSVAPRTGASLCLFGRSCCVCPSELSGPPVVAVGKSGGCCCTEEPQPATPCSAPVEENGCGCGCVDIWLPGSLARLEADRVGDQSWPVLAMVDPWALDLWSLHVVDARAPDVRGPECCGPPLVVATTRLVI